MSTTAPESAPPFLDDSPSEHIYIGSDELHPGPAATARTVRERVIVKNPVYRAATELTFYEEGFLKIKELRNGKRRDSLRLDLRYLDPIPTIARVVAKRSIRVALGFTLAAALTGWLISFESIRAFAIPTFVACFVTALGAAIVALYRSYERTEFCTLHGRATVLRLTANLGSIKRFRAVVPVLSRAIEDCAEQIGDDTAAYLRGEMREHYRLRGDGALTHEACAASTGRILAQFDSQL